MQGGTIQRDRKEMQRGEYGKRGEGVENEAEGWKEVGGCQRESAELGSSCKGFPPSDVFPPPSFFFYRNVIFPGFIAYSLSIPKCCCTPQLSHQTLLLLLLLLILLQTSRVVPPRSGPAKPLQIGTTLTLERER